MPQTEQDVCLHFLIMLTTIPTYWVLRTLINCKFQRFAKLYTILLVCKFVIKQSKQLPISSLPLSSSFQLSLALPSSLLLPVALSLQLSCQCMLAHKAQLYLSPFSIQSLSGSFLFFSCLSVVLSSYLVSVCYGISYSSISLQSLSGLSLQYLCSSLYVRLSAIAPYLVSQLQHHLSIVSFLSISCLFLVHTLLVSNQSLVRHRNCHFRFVLLGKLSKKNPL